MVWFWQWGSLRLQSLKRWQVLLQTPTNMSMRGTSIKTPTTVARAAPEDKPNNIVASGYGNFKMVGSPD